VSAAENKAVLAHAFAETAKGNGRPFVDMMADDVAWTIIGTTSWSRTYTGKASVIRDLLTPLAANFDGPNIVVTERFVAEDDLVVVEARNLSRTKRGEAYTNRYSWTFRFVDGRVADIMEYADTDLIARLLDPLPDQS